VKVWIYKGEIIREKRRVKASEPKGA